MDYEHVLAELNEIKARLIRAADNIKTSKSIASSTKQISAKKDEPVQIFSKLKVTEPHSEAHMQRSENMSPETLEAFTADSIANRYRKQWSKLETALKRDRFAAFSKSMKEPTDIENFIVKHYFETKKIRPKDIQYDHENGNIRAIPVLVREEDGSFNIRRTRIIEENKQQTAKQDCIRPSKSKPTISTLSKKLKRRG